MRRGVFLALNLILIGAYAMFTYVLVSTAQTECASSFLRWASVLQFLNALALHTPRCTE